MENKINDVLKQYLTDEQYQAVIDNNKEILSIACAGSGKSTTLAYRISRLLSEGESPESIVAITFTEKAAESIKLKVSQTLPKVSLAPELLGAMFIGTVHSFSKNLLGEIDAEYRQFEVLDENRFILYLISRYEKLELKKLQREKGSGYFQTIKEVSNAWQQMNNETIQIDDIIREDKILGTVLKDLKENLMNDKYIDYSLMIRLVVEKIEEKNQQALESIKKIKHLLVDEYQDTYPLQNRLFQLIHKYSSTLFVVGDDDQAIYGWNGADVSNILNFEKEFPECSKHTLSVNFRSTSTIVGSATEFAKRLLGSQRLEKDPIADPKNDKFPNQMGKFLFETREDEAEWVANKIESLLGSEYEESDGTKRGLTYSDFAILMRSTLKKERNGNPRHSAFTDALRARDIRVHLESEGSIFNYPSVRLLHDTFELLRNNNLERDKLRQFFNNEIMPIFPNASFENVSATLTEWQRNIHSPGRRKVKPQQLVHDILKAFDFAHTDFQEMEKHAIGQFSKVMNDVESVYFSIDTTYRFRSILNFLGYLRRPNSPDDYEASQGEILQRPDAVFVSTIHKAKGLEFPVVFVVDVQSGRFPGRVKRYKGWLPESLMQNAIDRGAYQNNIEGDIRLFYTAITRAERFLYVTGAKNLPGGKITHRESPFKESLLNDNIVEDPDYELPKMGKMKQIPRINENIMPTTFSEIRYYLQCPKNYQLRKIYGFNPVVPDLYGYGLAIHTAIGKLHQIFSESVPSEEEVEKITKDTFHLKHVPRAKEPETNPGPYERGEEKAIKLVKDYVSEYGKEFVKGKQIEQRFEIPASQTIITGSIDLLVQEDEKGNILDVTVIDFKSINAPDEEEHLDWVDLALQVQLYAKAANEVLGKNAKTGAVHLLREGKRVEIPIHDDAIKAAIKNIEWAVGRIIAMDFPMRPHPEKCDNCDFKVLCPKIPQNFKIDYEPPPIYLPKEETINDDIVLVKAFSQFEYKT